MHHAHQRISGMRGKILLSRKNVRITRNVLCTLTLYRDPVVRGEIFIRETKILFIADVIYHKVNSPFKIFT